MCLQVGGSVTLLAGSIFVPIVVVSFSLVYGAWRCVATSVRHRASHRHLTWTLDTHSNLFPSAHTARWVDADFNIFVHSSQRPVRPFDVMVDGSAAANGPAVDGGAPNQNNNHNNNHNNATANAHANGNANGNASGSQCWNTGVAVCGPGSQGVLRRLRQCPRRWVSGDFRRVNMCTTLARCGCARSDAGAIDAGSCVAHCVAWGVVCTRAW